MSQNASPDRDREVDDPVVARATQRALARRQAAYSEEVRRLLDAGLEVMRAAGTARSPRVTDIIDAAGLSRDAFYRHFASKEDLVAAIVEAGSYRLVSYLRHQMAKEREPTGQIRRWIQGVMSQATDAEVAHSTRAVLWNGARVGDRSRPEGIAAYAELAGLLLHPLAAVGSGDPARDAATICEAVVGRMQAFLWRSRAPTRSDITHLVRFCMAGVTAPPIGWPARGSEAADG